MSRFKIINRGNPFGGFEYEYHIEDGENENTTIIVKSGYGIKEETEKVVNEILNILNENN